MNRPTRHLTVLGTALEVRWDGPPPKDAPTLVFLHEGLGCVSMWRDFPAKLAAATDCGALTYSRLGYGESDPCQLPRPVRFMHDEGLTVLPALLEAAGVRECVLVGHSDGGSVAIVYAGGTAAPPLRGIITEAAHVFCEELSLHSIRKARGSFSNGDLRERLERHHGTNTECAFLGWSGAWLHPDFANWNLEEYLPGIGVPMLAIQGEDDEYGTAAQTEAIARKVGGDVEVMMLRDCGHSPHRDHEGLVLETMTKFVRSVFA